MAIEATHTTIAGDSGGGKSTLLRELQDSFEGVSIWLNHNGERNIAKNGRNAVHSKDGIISHIQSADSWRNVKIDYRPSGIESGAATVKDVALEIPRDVPVQVVADESHHLIADDNTTAADNPIKWLLHQGRDEKIRVVAATQDPMQWDYSPIKNAVNRVWVGQWAVEHKGYLNYFEFPRDELPTENYEYVVFDKRSNPVYRGETKPKYG